VLAGDAAAELDAGSRISRPAASTPDLVAIALVEEDDRMDVAVAGVEDVGDAQAMALARGGDARRMSGTLVRGTTPSWVQ
jgi:hypothetical protein